MIVLVEEYDDNAGGGVKDDNGGGGVKDDNAGRRSKG